MYNIKIEVRGQSLGIEQETIASNTLDYLTAKVIFSEDYQGLSKWLHIKKQGSDEEPYLINLNENDEVTRDMHLNLSEGTWEVFLHATSLQGMRITTIPCELLVRASGLIKGGQPLPEIPPSVAEQLDIKIQKALDIAQSVKDDADSGKFNGFSPIVKTEITQGGHNVLITDKDGVKSFYVKDGKDGANGKDGKDGINGTNGKDGQDGKDGKDGLNGKDGENGKDGKTPVKGVDYFTPQDIADIKKPLEDELQNLDHDKLGVERVVVGNDVVSQVEADEILSNYGNYDGKEIEFLTNGDLPNKVVARGHLVTDKEGNQYLIVVGVQGHIMRFHKGGVEYPYYRKKEVDYLQDVQNEYLVNTLGSFATKEGNPIVTTDSKDWSAKCEFSGSTSQEVREGYNLIDFSKIEMNAELVDSMGNTAFKDGWYVTDWINVKPGTTYILSGVSSDYHANLDLDGNVSYEVPNNMGTYWTFKITKSVRMRFNSKIDGYITPMFYEGEMVKPYEPYGKAPSPNFATPIINAKFTHVGDNGKNLIEEIKKGVYLNSNGQYNEFVDNYMCTNKIRHIKGMQLVASYGSSVEGKDIHAWDENGKWLGKFDNLDALNDNPNVYTFAMNFYHPRKPFDYAQIEIGSVATPYEPYKGFVGKLSQPIELAEGDYVFKDKDDKWKHHKEQYEVTYDGSSDEGWSYDGTQSEMFKTKTRSIVKRIGDFDQTSKCNRLENLKNYEFSSKKEGYTIRTYSNESYFFVRIKQFTQETELEQFKAFLTAHPLVVQYPLQTPIITELPQVDQELLNRIATFYPNTTITTDEGVTIKTEYLLDMKNYVDQNYAPKQSVNALEREMIK